MRFDMLFTIIAVFPVAFNLLDRRWCSTLWLSAAGLISWGSVVADITDVFVKAVSTYKGLNIIEPAGEDLITHAADESG